MDPSLKFQRVFSLCAALVLVGAMGAGANSILVPSGDSGGPCSVGNPNSARFSKNCGVQVTVATGEHYLSPSISSYLVRRRDRADELAARKPGLEDLTKAERRVLKLIAEKKTSREIGVELFISPRTVEAHRANISTKLQLRGNHSLLQFALENRTAI